MWFHSPYPDVTIPEQPCSDYVFEHISQWADTPAFIDGPSGRTLTFEEVAGAARRVASSMAARGLRKGDVFAIYSPNLPEYAVAVHGTLMCGGVVTTANPLYTGDELATQLQDAGAIYLCTVPPFLDKAKEAAAKAKVREIFVFGKAVGATPFAELLEGDGPPPTVPINPRDDIAILPYSSGTVGRPKGVMLTHYNLTAVLQQIAPLLLHRTGHRVLGILPFFHIFGLQVLLNHCLRHGVTCVTMLRFDLEAFLRNIQDYRITHLYLVPPLLLALAKHPLVDHYDLSSLQYILAGATPVDGELLVRGPNIMCGYLNNPEATRVTIDPEGWLHTGDIAYVDDEGYLFVVDRLKELIKYKGMQVAPAELEGLLLTHPAVVDAAVIGIPDAEAGEVPKAVVVLKAPVTAEELMSYVAGKVAPHKRIRQVEVVDAIPKSASGKILRRMLLERDQAQRIGPTMAP